MLSARLPKSADDWQLYVCSMKCGAAARALSSALRKAIQAQKKGEENVYEKYMVPVMEQYAKYGACDSEPRWVAQDALAQARRSL